MIPCNSELFSVMMRQNQKQEVVHVHESCIAFITSLRNFLPLSPWIHSLGKRLAPSVEIIKVIIVEHQSTPNGVNLTNLFDCIISD